MRDIFFFILVTYQERVKVNTEKLIGYVLLYKICSVRSSIQSASSSTARETQTNRNSKHLDRHSSSTEEGFESQRRTSKKRYGSSYRSFLNCFFGWLPGWRQSRRTPPFESVSTLSVAKDEKHKTTTS